MARLQAIDPDQATDRTKTLFDSAEQKLGVVPNLLRTMGNSPAVLDAYIGFKGALEQGVLSAKLREQIAITVAEVNGCNYCLAAHCAIGQSVGLSDQDVTDARESNSPESKVDAVLGFARRIVQERGRVTDETVDEVRKAGFGDAEIAEIVANVAYNIFSNYFNHVAGTEIDFPQVEPLTAA